ncbi:MAG: YihY/virulence factor BrkB family protein [Pseudomonadota bacterium]|nr:YihY/virulence factor BrkB family protein [Pseudomonadota bacterium]
MDTFKSVADLGACAARFWSSDNASTTGAALAFFSAFSLAPLLVIILTITGWILGSQAALGQIGSQLNALFGTSTAKILLDAMKSSQHAQGVIAITTSVVTLLVGATTILAALQQALDQIWQSGAKVQTGLMGWLRTRFLSLGFILALGFLLLASLTLTTSLSGIRSRIATSYPTMLALIGVLDLVVSLALVAALFAVIYRYMPARRLPWKVVLIGGVLTAVMFDIGRWAVGLYLAHSTQPSAFGAASSFVALLLWLYYTAQIFLFGAEFTACLGGLRQRGKGGEGEPPLKTDSRSIKSVKRGVPTLS